MCEQEESKEDRTFLASYPIRRHTNWNSWALKIAGFIFVINLGCPFQDDNTTVTPTSPMWPKSAWFWNKILKSFLKDIHVCKICATARARCPDDLCSAICTGSEELTREESINRHPHLGCVSTKAHSYFGRFWKGHVLFADMTFNRVNCSKSFWKFLWFSSGLSTCGD